MSPQDQKRAEAARDHLVRLLATDRNVSLIDFGFDPSENSKPLAQRAIVLRVHLRKASPIPKLPSEQNGFAVRTMVADYKLQS